jgi:hypothetical protein
MFRKYIAMSQQQICICVYIHNALTNMVHLDFTLKLNSFVKAVQK